MRLSIVISCLAGASVFGAEPTAQQLFQAGKRAFDARDYKAAVEQLLKAFRTNPEDVETNFFLGRASFETRDYETAAMAFERVLITAPDHSRAKLELARSYFNLGLYDVSAQYFREVLAENPPENVRRNIELFLERIRETRKRHFFSGQISIGVQRDTNVRVSPSNDSVQTANLLYELEEEDKKARDFVGTTMLILNHQYKTEGEKLWWKSSFVNYEAFYETEPDLDLAYFGFLTGPSWAGESFNLDLLGQYTVLRRDFETYMRAYGLLPSVAMVLSDNLLLEVTGRIEERTIHQDDEQDALNCNLACGPTLKLGGNRIGAQIALERENSSDDTESYDKISARLSYERELPFRAAAFAGYQVSEAYYEERDPVFAHRRDDLVQEFSAGITKQIGRKALAQLKHVFTDSESTQGLYDYERSVTSLTFSYAF